jgi:hypothetical protein
LGAHVANGFELQEGKKDKLLFEGLRGPFERTARLFGLLDDCIRTGSLLTHSRP